MPVSKNMNLLGQISQCKNNCGTSYGCAKTVKGSCSQIYENSTSGPFVPSKQVFFMVFAACFF